MAKVKKAAPRKKGANGYKLPDPIPLGEILTDIQKKKWQIGPSIGVGGFGEIYSASQVGEPTKKTATHPYVIKIEPHGNGPLFVEMHFYMRVGKQDDIAEWMTQHKLTHLGMPRFIGSGSHECHNEKYRFVVMDRYAQDLWNLFLENKRVFPVETVLRLAYQIINSLEYIHHKGYVHADIKGANLLLGMNSKSCIFLVDFGLASKHVSESKPNPKRAHNGTAEYTSRDAHTGAMTRRGDLEVLAYNLLQWLCSKLPWEDHLTDSVKLHQMKTAFMSNVRQGLSKCFGKSKPPDFLVKFFEYICDMSADQVPDYDHCRGLFKEGLKKCGASLEGNLQFSAASKAVKSPAAKKATPRRKAIAPQADDDEEEETTPSPNKRRRKKAVVEVSSSEAEEAKTSTFKSKAVKSPETKKATPRRKAIAPQADDDEEEETTPSPNKRRRKKAVVEVSSSKDEEEEAKTSTALRWRDYPAASASRDGPAAVTPARKEKKKTVTAAPSWIDHPAALASNVVRPGEYISVNGNGNGKANTRKLK